MGEKLSEKDKDLIKKRMLNQSLSILSEMVQCKEVIPNKIYEKEMRDEYKLIYLVNMLIF